jgi:hypothetical protein
MKKIILSFGLMAMASAAAIAQEKQHDHGSHAAAATEAPATVTTLTPENMAFKTESYDFGTVEEGPAAEHVFTFTNTGKEPLVIQRVQPSCGCTTPDWTKEPVAPGKTGMIKASYGTQGRPGPFEKTMTVFTNAGTRMVSFKGNVEKAPDSSAPQSTSMMRAN